ncbi:DUF3710 domain-containing protein [Kineococcus sp. TBRC 1896]|uniref:DUF3710 domain-containing protein n=1 Tax=Kineococcus mangrovi TaxID=1660183 RepID=A0ABV4I4I7_9ACTN
MSLFRRRKVAETTPTDPATGPAGADVAEDSASVTAAEAGVETASASSGVVDDPEARAAAEAGAPPRAEPAPEAFDRSAGPFDLAEVDEADERLVLGGLRLVGREGMELRFEVEEGSGRVIAVTVGMNGSTVQLQVFAAPRTSGVWEEIRPEIAQAVLQQGGAAEEQDGPLGRELLCRLPVRTEDGRTAHQPTRFAGVDGPRWFLRAVFSGPAAHDAASAAELESVVREAVVVRGDEAMAPRELIALALPEQPAPVEAPAGETSGRADLDPFERGPEITEVR